MDRDKQIEKVVQSAPQYVRQGAINESIWWQI